MMAWSMDRMVWPKRHYGSDFLEPTYRLRWIKPWEGWVSLSSHGCVGVRAWTRSGCSKKLFLAQAELTR